MRRHAPAAVTLSDWNRQVVKFCLYPPLLGDSETRGSHFRQGRLGLASGLKNGSCGIKDMAVICPGAPGSRQASFGTSCESLWSESGGLYVNWDDASEQQIAADLINAFSGLIYSRLFFSRG